MPIKLTQEEFVEKYGDVMVKFSSYYKYTFTYVGQLPDGGKLVCSYGGNADDIYRYDVDADKEVKAKDVFDSAYIYNKDGLCIEEVEQVGGWW